MADNKLEVEITAVSEGLTSGLNAASSQVAGAVSKMTGSFSALTIAAGVVVGAIAGIVASISEFISEAGEAETIENRLRYALQQNGIAWSDAKSAVDEFANSVMEQTRFSDEDARAAMTRMTMYTQEFGKAQIGARLAMDLSTRTGMDLQMATMQIGNAMQGNIGRLGRYVPELKNLKDRMGEFATSSEIAAKTLEILQSKLGGAAASDVNTYEGALKQFSNQWKEFKEVLGSFLIGPAAGILKWLTDIIKQFRELFDLMKSRPEEGAIPQLEYDIKQAQAKLDLLKQTLATLNAEVGSGDTEALEKEIYRREEWIVSLKKQLEAAKAARDEKLAGGTKDDLTTAEEIKKLRDLKAKIEEEVYKAKASEKAVGWEDSMGAEGYATIDGVTRKIDEWVEIQKGLTEALKESATQSDEFISSSKQMLDIEERTTEKKRERLELENRINGEIAAARSQEAAVGWEDAPGLPKGMAQIGNQIGAIDAWAARIEKQKEMFRTVFSSIGSSFSGMVTGILQGTQTLSQGIQNLAVNITSSLINAFIQIGLQWVMTQLEMLIFGKAAGAISAVSRVTQEAAVAAAGAYAATAMIPFVGPGLAPAAAATAYAGAMSFAPLAAAERGWDVDRDSIAMLHKREMVLPANLAENVRTMTGTGTSRVQFKIDAMDGASVERVVKKSIIPSLRKSFRNGSR